ncbi:hypothetical protein ACFWN1_15635 [Streptomyces sp. NPDC058459]|uniref:hypothetical protein n=1 Tax=Streptomyces sp. NPDC058459 TaxID=3346508 RepID=UPI00365A8119
MEGVRSLLYFGDDGIARHVWTLVARLVVGIAVTGITALWEGPARRTPDELPGTSVAEAGREAQEERAAEEEAEETVAV